MPIQDPDYQTRVRRLFEAAAFLGHIGVELRSSAEGVCESGLRVGPQHGQQDGFVHAGVVATLADHTAGAAALTCARADQTVLTVEFKINLLRPAVGESLRCRAAALRLGRTLAVVESEVFARAGERESLVAKATVTLAIVDADVGARPRGGGGA